MVIDNMKRVLFMGIISTMFGLFSCHAQSDKGQQPKEESRFVSVEADEFERMIADTAIVRLDVRTPEEYAEGHIDGAVNIDVLDDGFEQKATSTFPASKTIALYCRSGNRSKKAARILSAKGYRIIELNTGYKGWTAYKKN